MLALAAVVLASSGCQTIVLGAPKFPPCYREDAARMAESDRIERHYPATYLWIREMDAICESWTE